MRLFSCMIYIVSAMDMTSGEYDQVQTAEYKNRLATAMWNAERLSRMNRSRFGRNSFVCYEPLGCFSRDPIGELPENPRKIPPQFKLYTNSSQTPAAIFRFNSSFKSVDPILRKALESPYKALVLVAHGFGGHGNLRWIREMRAIEIEKYNANVVIIDWKLAARITTVYTSAAANAPMIGLMAAHFVLSLVKEFGIPIENVQFVGFSLGAHIGGSMAEEIHRKTHGRTIGQLTALDAASPLFEGNGFYPNKNRVQFLEAVHTSSGNDLLRGKLGLEANFGHVDYYPNGGRDQPGCSLLDVTCSHFRAVDYYLEAIAFPHRCRYSGHLCSSVLEARRGLCSPTRDQSHYLSMGRCVKAPFSYRGVIIYLKTNAASPFCVS